MTEYKCSVCGKLQYTADTKSTDPCIFCGGPCTKTVSEEKSPETRSSDFTGEDDHA